MPKIINTIPSVRKQVAIKLSYENSFSQYWRAKRKLRDSKKLSSIEKSKLRKIIKDYQQSFLKDTSITKYKKRPV